MSSLSKNSEGKGQGSHKATTSHPCDLTWAAFLNNSFLGTDFSRGPTAPSAGKALLNALTRVSVVPEGWHLQLFSGIWAHST